MGRLAWQLQHLDADGAEVARPARSRGGGRARAAALGEVPPRATSFYLDCSASSTGLPPSVQPRVRCPEPKGILGTLFSLLPFHRAKTCRPFAAECARLKRALEKKTMVTKSHWGCRGEQVFVNFLDGDAWLKCCVSGKPGQERSKCEFMYQEPPKKPVKPTNHLAAVASAAVEAATATMGGGSCEGTGTYPAPTHLIAPLGEGDFCVQWGLPGELYPQDPMLGELNYKVFQMAAPWAAPPPRPRKPPRARAVRPLAPPPAALAPRGGPSADARRCAEEFL